MPQTLWEVLDGRIVLRGDSNWGRIYTWNLSQTFQVWEHRGDDQWQEVEGARVTMGEPSLQEAIKVAVSMSEGDKEDEEPPAMHRGYART